MSLPDSYEAGAQANALAADVFLSEEEEFGWSQRGRYLLFSAAKESFEPKDAKSNPVLWGNPRKIKYPEMTA